MGTAIPVRVAEVRLIAIAGCVWAEGWAEASSKPTRTPAPLSRSDSVLTLSPMKRIVLRFIRNGLAGIILGMRINSPAHGIRVPALPGSSPLLFFWDEVVSVTELIGAIILKSPETFENRRCVFIAYVGRRFEGEVPPPGESPYSAKAAPVAAKNGSVKLDRFVTSAPPEVYAVNT